MRLTKIKALCGTPEIEYYDHHSGYFAFRVSQGALETRGISRTKDKAYARWNEIAEKLNRCLTIVEPDTTEKPILAR